MNQLEGDGVTRPAYGIAGLVGAIAFLASLAVVHAVRSDIADWTVHYVSDFANGPLGWVFVLGAALHGTGNLALGAGLRELAGEHRLGRWAALLFMLAAAGIVATAFLPADGAGREPTAIGLAHRAVVAASFVLELAALFAFSALFAAMPRRHAPARVSFALASLAAAALGAFALAVIANRAPGLAERFALASFLAWEVWAALTLLGARRVPGFEAYQRFAPQGRMN